MLARPEECPGGGREGGREGEKARKREGGREGKHLLDDRVRSKISVVVAECSPDLKSARVEVGR